MSALTKQARETIKWWWFGEIGGALILFAAVAVWVIRLFRRALVDPVDAAYGTALAALWPDDDDLPPAACPCEDCTDLTADAAELVADLERYLRLPRWRRALLRRPR